MSFRKSHSYHVDLTWTGNRGSGTSAYTAYGREHRIVSGERPPLEGSSDPAFRGDARKWSPEELFVASIAACHQLWYLHLCAEGGVVVTAYADRAEGTMVVESGGGGRFTAVVLHPEVTVTEPAMIESAQRLHAAAHAKCFIANSLNFPVTYEPLIRTV